MPSRLGFGVWGIMIFWILVDHFVGCRAQGLGFRAEQDEAPKS